MKELGLEPRSGIVMNFPFWVPLPAAVPRNKRPQEGIRFLAAGRLIERKGYAHLIKACGILRKHGFRSFKLEIAGVGPESERLSNLTEELGVSEHVEFLGWLQPNELAEARARNEVFVHVVPEEDPFPVAVLEAMAAGMVVLGSKRAGSVVDRVRDGIDGLVLEGGDPEEIARAMGRLMKGDSDVRRMGRSARKTAATWHPDRGVEKMSWLLDQVGTES